MNDSSVAVRAFAGSLMVLLVSLCGSRQEAMAADDSGVRLFQRNCASCHLGGLQVEAATAGVQAIRQVPYAPLLSRHFLIGREQRVRTLIVEGGVRMPGFKYKLQPQDVDKIIAYLQEVETAPISVGRDRVDP